MAARRSTPCWRSFSGCRTPTARRVWISLHTPGHTPGSVCLHSPSRRFVIVGDLLQRARGHVTLPNYFFTDDMSLARRSIGRLAELDVDTILFSHYPPCREQARDALRQLAS